MDTTSKRWPTIYDAEGLRRTIEHIATADALSKKIYYQAHPPLGLCQGDIFTLEKTFAFIDAEGEWSITDDPYQHWIVLGNTCDLDRSSFTTLCPLVHTKLQQSNRESIIKYKNFHSFYLPPWDGSENHWIADFRKIISIEVPLLGKASLQAQLSREGWVLFHSCLVRFLARDDGREDV